METKLKPAPEKPAARLDICVPELNVWRVSPPETGSRTVIVESSVKGRQVQKEPIKEELSARIHLYQSSPSDSLKILGVEHKPNGRVEMTLWERGGELHASVEYSYEKSSTRIESEGYGARIIRAGQEVAPYCYAQHDDIEYSGYRDVEVPYKETVKAYPEIKLTPEKLAVLAAGLHNAAIEGDEKAVGLLSILCKHHAAAMGEAEKIIAAMVTDKVKRLRDEASAVAEGLEKFSFGPSNTKAKGG